MKLAFKEIDVMTVIIYLVEDAHGGQVDLVGDGVRMKLPRGVRHGTAIQMIHDLIKAVNEVMEVQP